MPLPKFPLLSHDDRRSLTEGAVNAVDAGSRRVYLDALQQELTNVVASADTGELTRQGVTDARALIALVRSAGLHELHLAASFTEHAVARRHVALLHRPETD
jgi:hypothetical protein